MALQKTLNNLKQGPKEDKIAVASGVAVSVVLVLLVAWAIFFFRNIQKGGQSLDFGGGAQDEFNFTSVKDAQQQLQNAYQNTADDLRQIRIDAAASQTQTQDPGAQQLQGSDSSQFSPGGGGTTY